MFARFLAFGGSFTGVALVVIGCHSFDASEAPAEDAAPPTEVGPGADGGLEGEASAQDGTSGEGAAPRPIMTLATGFRDLRAVVANSTHVYFAEQGGSGGIFKVPIGGGTAMPLSMGGAPSSIALAGGFVYWPDVAAKTLNRVSTDGGTRQTALASDLTASVVAISSDRLFALAGSVPPAIPKGEIRQYDLDLQPLTGGTLSSLENPISVAGSRSQFFWIEGATSNTIARADDGMANRMEVASESDVQSITADDVGVYWAVPGTTPNTGTIRGVLFDAGGSVAGASVLTLSTNENMPHSIASDRDYVYWTTASNELRRTGHQNGGMSSLFADGFTAITELHARGIAVTADYVVWLTDDGKVLARHK